MAVEGVIMALQAGVGVREIHPDQPLFLVGYPMSSAPSTGVHDPLYASALCLGDAGGHADPGGGRHPVFQSAGRREFRRRIAETTGVAADGVFISTPTPIRARSPATWPRGNTTAWCRTMSQAYFHRVGDAIVAAARAAHDSLRPAELA